MSKMNHTALQPAAPERARAGIFCAGLLGVLVSCGQLLGEVEVYRLDPSPDAPATQPGTSLSPDAATAATCEVGQARCQGSLLQHCESDGSGWRPVERCASAALCVDAEGQRSRCIEPACQPGTVCEGEALQRCNADLTGYERIDTCSSAAHCDAALGVCQAVACLPGEISCNGNVLQRCNGGPSGHDPLLSCATPELCSALLTASCGADLPLCDVTSVTCPSPVCAPGERRCDGPRLELCNAGQTGWEVLDECASSGICELTRQTPAALSCIEAPCLSGSNFCSPDGALLACNPQQTGYTVPLSQCRAPELCHAELAQCLECDPVGSSRCEGASVRLCSAQHTEIVAQVCASPELCRATGPSSVACEDSGCTQPFQCTISGEVLACNQGQTGYVAQSPRVFCDTPALCDVTAASGCAARSCAPGARRCAGQVVETCNEGLTSFRPLETCDSSAGLSCRSDAPGSAACACTPGAYRCVAGRGLLKCSPTGAGFVDIDADAECEAASRVSCDGARLVRDACKDAEHCQASNSGSCAACIADTECASAGFCAGVASCDRQSQRCVQSGNPCGPSRVCSEQLSACVECVEAADCPGPQVCVGNVCSNAPDSGT
jgi:hypothetical protein